MFLSSQKFEMGVVFYETLLLSFYDNRFNTLLLNVRRPDLLLSGLPWISKENLCLTVKYCRKL